MNLTSKIITTILLLIITACTHTANHETESQYVHIDFKNLSIPEFADKVSSMINKKIIFKHKVEGKINFVANSEDIKRDELIPLLNAILDSKNMTLVNRGTYYSVVRGVRGCYDELSNLQKINNIKEAMFWGKYWYL